MPKCNPQEGEYWSKQLFRIGDSTPYNILRLPKDSLELKREVFVQRINDKREPIGESIYVPAPDFQSLLVASGEENVFFRAKDTVFVDGRNANMVIFHNIDQNGNLTGPKQMVKKEAFLMDYQFYGGMHPAYKQNGG